MLEYLEKYHKDDISQIVHAESLEDIGYRALPVDLAALQKNNNDLYQKITKRINVWKEKPKWTKALNQAQENFIQVNLVDSKMYDFTLLKEDFPVTFVNCPEILNEKHLYHFKQLWHLMQVRGSVFRTRERAKREISREYRCRKCKKAAIVNADRIRDFYFDVPDRCTVTPGCNGTMNDTDDTHQTQANLNHIIEYQEVTIQLNRISDAFTVELEEELVESCFIGDSVRICGTLELRSKKDFNDHRLVFRAVSVIVDENQQKNNIDPNEMKLNVMCDWESELRKFKADESKIKDEMVLGFAPEIGGLAIVKLAVLIVLCSGGRKNFTGGCTQVPQKSTNMREISHLLMVGEPGLGKSQILRAASEVSVKSMRVIGYSATTAGLTANCVTEGGETHIEAGALAKANNGICCIDEINFLSKEHRGSIHEAMESQKISMAKYGMHANINTKCSILAGMNQKNLQKPVEAQNLSLEQSLLSRFDLIFEFENLEDPEMDLLVTNHIFDSLAGKKVQNWDHDRLQAHIQVAKELRVEITEDALEIIQKYFVFCRNNDEIDPSRKSYRLLNNLQRLTVCHAKLMLRTKAGIDDAVAMVMLVESSWTFGGLLDMVTVVRSNVPLGPTRDMKADILDRLDLNELLEKKISQNKFETSQGSVGNVKIDESIVENMFSDDDEDITENLDSEKGFETTQELFSDQIPNLPSSRRPIFMSPPASSKSIHEKLNESIFKSPSVTSTQFSPKFNSKFNSKNSDEIVPIPESSKMDLSGSDDSDIFANLNFVAANFENFEQNNQKPTNIESDDDLFSTPPPATVKTPKRQAITTSPPTNSNFSVSNKLKKFKYSEEQTQEKEKVSENVAQNSQKSNEKVESKPEEKILSAKEVEEMDFFDFEF